MKIKTVPIGQVLPYDKNPRNNAQAVDGVAASIAEFGWRQPIVVDEDMVVIVGHTRLLAAQKMGLEKVPVHIAEGLTPEQVKAYRISDNRTGELAEWETELLQLEIEELAQKGYDTLLTGFDDEQLTALLENEESEQPAESKTKILPPDPDPEPSKPDANSGLRDYSPPEFKPMDIIDLGPHNLTVGFEEMGLLKKIIKLVRKEAPKLEIRLNGDLLPVEGNLNDE